MGKGVRVVTAAEAADHIPDGCTLFTVGFTLVGAAESVLKAIEERFRRTGRPRDLTLFHAAGQSDRQRGIEHLAYPGLVRRVIGAHWGLAPRWSRLIAEEEVECFCLPQGQILSLLRAEAAGQPGHLSRVGLGTFVDPRLEGGRMNARTLALAPPVEVWEVGGEEYLFYKAIPIHVALLRATTADEAGNLSAEDEPLQLELLAAAQAARRYGGKVIAQVKRLAQRGSLHPKQIVVPGILVDEVVVSEHPEEDHRQTSSFYHDGAYSGEIRAPEAGLAALPLSVRKLIGRRGLLEISPGDVVNLGTGIPGDTIGPIAQEEGVRDALLLTVESGAIGGVPSGGQDFGISRNPEVLLEHTRQFDYYTGTGVDVTLMGAAEIDGEGNVNVSAFGGRVIGCGGFIDITQSARKVVFLSAFRVGRMEAEVQGGRLVIRRDGEGEKFVSRVRQVTFSGPRAVASGQQVVFVTERAVFSLTREGLVLTEVAPGVDLQRDVLDKMGFRPRIQQPLKPMDPRLFTPAPLGLAAAWRLAGPPERST